LIGRDKLSARLKRKVDSVKYSTSCLSLFFATDMDLRGAGLDSGNFWFYDHADVDKIYSDGLTDALLHEDTPPGMFLTATTLKDPSKMHSRYHTCESFAFVGYDAFEKWANNYLNATRGNLYGIEKSPSQVGPWAFSPRTEFEGLYLCGASTLSHGVAGVTQSGIDAAKAVLNCRTRDLLKQHGASLTFLPSEDVSVWPENLRKKMERWEVAREDEEREV
jgi:all-trans-retinol 13,14-reductase